ncbi:uncharacterized protein LOC111475461 [Cucurbita maxima]|uniref:Uncharacterized protein LOC111475461 n=1 Tax=Cucurbita maxima TaxID=3661 RepID=A0A6J1IHB5_CUCMA|nr:uncharacterized protein LOC111475461 [Cucurbita maxima]
MQIAFTGRSLDCVVKLFFIGEDRKGFSTQTLKTFQHFVHRIQPPIINWIWIRRSLRHFKEWQGKTRLAKYKVECEVHRLVVNSDPNFRNSVEFRTHKVIYRQYAGLFFSICVDKTDNYLESVRLFVEVLDQFFSNVYLILDEFILAGKLQETSKKAPQNQLEPSATDIRLYEDHVCQVKVESLIDMEMPLRTSKTKLLAGIDLIRRLKVSALETENESKLKSKRSELEFRCQMVENVLGILEKLKSSGNDSNEKWKDGVIEAPVRRLSWTLIYYKP